MDTYAKLDDLHTLNLADFDSVHLAAQGATYALLIYRRPLLVQSVRAGQQAPERPPVRRLEVMVSSVEDTAIQQRAKAALGGRAGDEGWKV